MPGKTKRKYDVEIYKFNKSLKQPLNQISKVLPYNYSCKDILALFEELYPYEWDMIKQRYKHYAEKDKFLVGVHKKKRYKPIPPKKYLLNLPKVKYILSNGYKRKHQKNFSASIREELLQTMKEKTKSRMLKRDAKIQEKKKFMQSIEPIYTKIFFHAYHKKGITQEGKMEIVKELQKYESDEILRFFYKLNDSERNTQIRLIAFHHLQDLGIYVKMRKNFKGKKKSYMLEKIDFDKKPSDLFDRIKQDSIQNKKTFDYFISHSYKDTEIINVLIGKLNKAKLHLYCDWMADSDFLKRAYVSKFTREVLKRRIEQSKRVLFVKTKNTVSDTDNILSRWVKIEILYAKKLRKEIQCLNLYDNDKMLDVEVENFIQSNLNKGLKYYKKN